MTLGRADRDGQNDLKRAALGGRRRPRGPFFVEGGPKYLATSSDSLLPTGPIVPKQVGHFSGPPKMRHVPYRAEMSNSSLTIDTLKRL